MSDFYLVLKNLTRKKLRLVLTLCSIFIAFLIFGAVTALKGALNSGVEMSAENRLVTVHKVTFTQPLPYAYVTKVKAMAGVDQVTHSNWFGGYYQRPENQVIAFAVDAETYFDVFSELVVPEQQMTYWQQARGSMLVGERLARNNGWQVGDRIPVNSNIFTHKDGGNTWDFEIAGIFTAEEAQVDTNYMVFHYRYFMETQTRGGDYVGWLVLTTEDPSLNEQVAKGIDEEFANSDTPTDTSTEKAFNKAFIEQIGNIGLIIFSVVFMAFFTILILVGNTMVLAIRERTREIAVLKTIGFSSARIFKMVLMESCLLAFIGGVLGLVAAYMAIQGAADFLARFLPDLVMGTDTVVQGFVYMLALGLITGIIPAYGALKLNIISALAKK